MRRVLRGYMRSVCVALFVTCLTLYPAAAQPWNRHTIDAVLGFENGTPGQFPTGWTSNLPDGIVTDDQVYHSGNYSARIQRSATSGQSFSTVTISLPLDFAGNVIQLRAWIKTEIPSGYATIWLREDSSSGQDLDFADYTNISGVRP